jgi:putative phosphoribosyl transferase
MFTERIAAGHALAEAIAPLLDGPVVVAAIPSGGVPVARPVAERLGAPLALVHARKLVVPEAAEFTVGAVDEDGYALFDDLALDTLRVEARDLEVLQIRAARQIGVQMARCGRASLPRLLAPGTELVLVDDGLATGWTMRAALAYARRHGARRVTVAAPCASEPAAEYFREHADRFLCLIVNEALLTVGEYYEDFSPVDDAQVRELLARPIDIGGGVITARPC